jgi:hypothetical protein
MRPMAMPNAKSWWLDMAMWDSVFWIFEISSMLDIVSCILPSTAFFIIASKVSQPQWKFIDVILKESCRVTHILRILFATSFPGDP